MPVQSSPYSGNVITTELIQKYLDENKQLILAILDNQNLGKLNECAQLQRSSQDQQQGYSQGQQMMQQQMAPAASQPVVPTAVSGAGSEVSAGGNGAPVGSFGDYGQAQVASCPAGVVCPAGASCVVDGSGFPFCKCAAGQAIINGVCAPAASWATVGTNVVLYNRASYTNFPKTLAPAVLRGAAPNTSACVNLPAAFNGSVGSLRIMWNVNDGVANHLVCGKLFFWDKPNCCCSGSGYQIPGGWTTVDPNKFTYTTTSVKSASGIILKARSISCQAAIATNTYPCATKTCPVNAACSVVNGAAVCTCNAGYSMVNGQCVATTSNPCTGYSCPANSACSNVNGVATCTCNTGYQMVNGQCVVPNPCTGYTCPANSACSNVNGVATCTCNTGYQMVNGQCVVPNPCTGYSCPANSACSNVNGVATCTCNTGYQMVNGQCVVPNPCTGYSCPANSACSNVNGVATCTCNTGYQMVNGQCVVPNPCTGYTCPANSACSNVNGVATCTCNTGYQMVNGQCVVPNPCTGYSCPANSACTNVNGVATCTCSTGYQMTAGQCVAITDACLTTTCPAKATCSSVNGVATCVCAVGYTMVSGACQPASPCSLVTCPANCTCSAANGIAKCACADLCYGVRCPDVSKCTYMLGAPVCTCPPPYTRLIDNKCSNATLAFSNYLDNHNAARAAVGAVPLVWNATLATRAQAWATALTNSTYNCGLSHGGNSGEGQNLSGASPSGWASDAAAVSWWVGEGDLYSYAVFSGGCSTGNWADCGHYTQVIWNNTRTVGCAKASCGTKSDVWACHYYPPGNYGGQLPYVQDPCYRVACPSTATCTVRYGQPMCVCGAGQVLVNNATCQPDPCASGTTTCPGNLVCDGSSGSAQCACPTGLVPITSDTCVPPACVGAVCPAQATCAVDGSGYPFCQCPTGWYLGSNVCVQGTPAAVAATSLAIYNTASYTSTAPALGPTLVRTGLPANSSRGSCVDIPGGIAAASLRVLWNVPDSTGAPKQSCGLLWFWTSASCYGSATGYYRPAGDVTNFASVPRPPPLPRLCFLSLNTCSMLSFSCGAFLTLIALCCAVSPLCACSTTSGNVALVKAVACAI
ncbi:unnamed protein product [Closterium sp. NIES-64]|nr:unnamed protein product [Closterium sp. NIES-64]